MESLLSIFRMHWDHELDRWWGGQSPARRATWLARQIESIQAHGGRRTVRPTSRFMESGSSVTTKARRLFVRPKPSGVRAPEGNASDRDRGVHAASPLEVIKSNEHPAWRRLLEARRRTPLSYNLLSRSVVRIEMRLRH